MDVISGQSGLHVTVIKNVGQPNRAPNASASETYEKLGQNIKRIQPLPTLSDAQKRDPVKFAGR